MDASTTIPTANASPASEITLIDKPSPAITTKVEMIDTGIAIITIAVGANARKKVKRTTIARIPPIMMLF